MGTAQSGLLAQHYKFTKFRTLPFCNNATTNYDLVLEHALTAITMVPSNSLHFEGTTKSKIHEFLRSLNFNRSLKKMVVHLHGIYDANESIVLGGKEYSSKYGFGLAENKDTLFDHLQNGQISKDQLSDLLIRYGYEWPLRRKLLWTLLATRRVVFVGFSMSDPYFNKMLEFIKDDLSTYNGETHFLVLRVTPSSIERSVKQAKRIKREYGIQTVFFQDEEEDFLGIGQFIAQLEDQVNAKADTVGIIEKPATADGTATKDGDPALTDKLFSLSKNQYTDED